MAYQFTQTGAQIQSILDQVGTNTSDISTINNVLTQNTAYKRLSATNTSVTLTGGAVTTVNFTFTVPTGYMMVAAFDASYYAGYVAAPIRIQTGTGSGKYVTLAYYAPTTITRDLTCAVLMLPNVSTS